MVDTRARLGAALLTLLLTTPWTSRAQGATTDESGIEHEVEDDFSAESPLTKQNDSPEQERQSDAPAVPEGDRQIFEESQKSSSSSGEPIFDWSKHKSEKEVPHPFAEKGLIRVTKDRDYLYKTTESDQTRAIDFKVGMYEPKLLKNPETSASFEDSYNQSQNPLFMANYEWQFWPSAVGKWGLRAGGGLFFAQGHGHFAAGVNEDKVPREVFTFIMVPINLGVAYRMHIWHRQLIIPYAEGGGTIFGFTETRDDDKPPKFGGSLGAYYAGGVAFNLSYFDAISRIQLDREYGINSVYLTVEYRGIVSIMRNFDFTANFLTAGFLMEL